MTTRFIRGPADGVKLELAHNPPIIRVTRLVSPGLPITFDALDREDDEPKDYEEVYVYLLETPGANGFIDYTDKNGKRCGRPFFSGAVYGYSHLQPENAVMRNTEEWMAWSATCPLPAPKKPTERTPRRKEPVKVPHVCHAMQCKKEVPPKLLMCGRHWAMVPDNIQKMIWKYYVPGQEVRKDPTVDYLNWMRSAILAVAVAEKLVTRDEAIEDLRFYRKKIGWVPPAERPKQTDLFPKEERAV